MVKKVKKRNVSNVSQKKSLRVGVQQKELEFSEEKNSRLTLKAQL